MFGHLPSGLHTLLMQACRQHLNLYQMGCMSFLYVNGEREPQAIVNETGISKSHVYYALRELEKQGIVRKRQDRQFTSKRRVALWSLTRKGEATVREWVRVCEEG